MSETIETKLDRFELITELASGGMGTVFLARLGGAGGFQRLYAIKRLHKHLARHAEFIEMFLDEARLAARIHHPNVVPILEIVTTKAGYHLVMEYVEGDTAGHLFHCAAQEGKVIAPGVTIRIVLDALAGLHAAHEGVDDGGHPLEIVHRDVSPHNILISVDGVSRIADFGIARAASRLAVTRVGELKGKIAYMAPEQARSERIDRRADIFAMGICLWEMLTRRRLFRADAEGETLSRLLYESIPSPRSVEPSISREIDAVCLRALERDLERRFATAAEFSEALEGTTRSLGLLGTHRDVAACVAQFLGTDLSERRAGLRAWIADTERRSLAPPSDARAPAGARVSVHVPPLSDPGTLGACAELSDPSKSSARRRFKGLGLAIVGAMIAGSVAGVGWWHAHARGPLATAVRRTGDEAEARLPPPNPAVSPPDNAPPSIDAAPSPSARPPVGNASAPASAPAAGSGSTAVKSARPVTNPLALPVEPAPTASSAHSVPADMLFNPYR